MKKLHSLLAVTLVAVMLATALSGCFGGGKKAPEKQTVDKVYSYTDTVLHTLEHPADDETFTGQSYVGFTAVDASGYLFTVQEMNAEYETVAVTAYLGDFGGGEQIAVSLPITESEDGYRSMQNFLRLSDGLLVTVYENKVIDEENYVYENNFFAEIYNFDGSLRQTLDFKKIFNVSAEGYINVNQIAALAGDLYMTVYTSDEELSNKIVRIGLDGTLKEIISVIPEGKEGYINSIRPMGDSKLYVPVELYGEVFEQKLMTLDVATGAREEVSIGDDYEILYRSFVGADGGIYYSNENGVFSVSLATGEKTMLMDFINSDYIYNYGNFFALDAEHFASLSQAYDDNVETLTLTSFEKVPEEKLTPKYVITVASAGGVYSFRNQIIEFNRASEDFRIRYVDYSQYNTEEDYTAGQTKLNNDIIAGNVPDVLITDQQFSAAKYVNKGLFVDLYTLMDKDETFPRDAFLPNVLEAFEQNGKLYEIPTNVYLLGFVGQAERIAEFDGLTMRQFADKVAALPEGVSFFREGDYSRNELMETFFFTQYGNFIDPATGLCRLNNDEFKAMIEWLGTIPEKSRWEQDDFDYGTFDYDAYENTFKEGKAIATWTSLDSFYSLNNHVYEFGDGELVFIGAPASDGDGMVLTTTNLKFLVSAKGNFPEEAWNFVKVFFTEKNQRELSWGFPVTKAALDAEKQAVLDEIEKREKQEDAEQNTKPIIGGGIATMPMYPVRNVSREDVEKIYGYVTRVHKAMSYDESILDIVKEEASEYYGGKKRIDDVAVQAESRVNIKIGEQM